MFTYIISRKPSHQQQCHLLSAILIGIREKFRQEQPDDFGILSEVLKNSAAVCSSDTIPTGEVDEFHYVVFYLLYFSNALVSILSVEQKAAEFFKDSSRNSANQPASAIEVKFRNSACLLHTNLGQIIKNNVNLFFRIK